MSWERIETALSAAGTAMAAEPWQPPGPEDLLPGAEVMAFDATLSASGWVHLETWQDEGAPVTLSVIAKGTLRVRTDLKGYLATYDKAARMKNLISQVIWQQSRFLHPEQICWEAPVVAGHRTESSLIAGYLVYEASQGAGRAVPANHASKLLTGSPRHDKQEIRTAVARFVPEAAVPRAWTEHECDALAVALADCLDAKRLQAVMISNNLDTFQHRPEGGWHD